MRSYSFGPRRRGAPQIDRMRITPLAMPLLRGETLAQRIARGRLSVAPALVIFEAVAEGVAAIHDAGLVHRDLKPENVFLTRTGEDEEAVILDLGIAREIGSASSARA
jgi:serine/threonine-protein kinase